MHHRFPALLLTAAALVPLHPLEGPAGERAVSPVYSEVTLENFETTPYTDAQISCAKPGGRTAGLAIRDRLPATAESRKYLEARMHTGGDDVFVITPAKELIIEGHCRSISLYAYGIKTDGTLSFLLMDTGGRSHLLRAGRVNFSGWRKIEVRLGNTISQADDFLNQGKTMKILQVRFHTAGPEASTRRWEYLYLDDITATARDRYLDRRSEEW
ncbi:MAG: hypothetical protein JW838_03330 [Spirochaetes bacterium]|nr:hypothetical protein [Spirochaetota bacterium]